MNSKKTTLQSNCPSKRRHSDYSLLSPGNPSLRPDYNLASFNVKKNSNYNFSAESSKTSPMLSTESLMLSPNLSPNLSPDISPNLKRRPSSSEKNNTSNKFSLKKTVSMPKKSFTSSFQSLFCWNEKNQRPSLSIPR
jgi:hypothetical protein